MLQRTYLGLAFGMIAPATIFAAQQFRSLDKSQSSTLSSSSSATSLAAQVQADNQTYWLELSDNTLPDDQRRLPFSALQLRHARVFKALIEDEPEIEAIPIKSYITTMCFDDKNPDALTLKDLHKVLEIIENAMAIRSTASDYCTGFSLCEYLVYSHYSDKRLIQSLLVASYFDIPDLLDAIEKHIISRFETKEQMDRILSLPDDVQAQLVAGHVRNDEVIRYFFMTPKKAFHQLGLLGTKIVSPDGKFATAAFYDSLGHWMVEVSNAYANKTLISYSLKNNVSALNCSPDGSHIVFGYESGRISVKKIIYNAEDDTVQLEDVWTEQGHDCRINAIAYSPDGTGIVSVSDRKLLVLSAAYGACIAERKSSGYRQSFSNVVYSPDGSKIAIAEKEDEQFQDPINGKYGYRVITHLHVWDMKTKITLREYRVDDEIKYIRWSDDGEAIIAVTRDQIILWHWKERRSCYVYWNNLVPSGHATTPILFAELSPDGAELSASSGTTTWIWNILTRNLTLLTLPQFELVKEIIREEMIPVKPNENADDLAKKLYATYHKLPSRWKKILTDRFAPTSAAASAVGAEASSSSAASSAVT